MPSPVRQQSHGVKAGLSVGCISAGSTVSRRSASALPGARSTAAPSADDIRFIDPSSCPARRAGT
jgi:hypothetical protein